MMTTLARPSGASLLLVMKAKGQAIGTATGFLVKKDESVLLFTNRHVVRGRHNYTNEVLSSSGAVPDEVEIYHNKKGKTGVWIPVTEHLYDDLSPLWLEHPDLREKADVVALQLSKTKDIEVLDYDPTDAGPEIRFGPSEKVSIVGFPFGKRAGGCLAIWVTGTLASESIINYDDLPQFLVDSRTRPGQSGSPVILYRAGGMVAMDNGESSVFSGPVTRFVGIYSGRINAESDLGIVWKIEVVQKIRDAGVRGTM